MGDGGGCGDNIRSEMKIKNNFCENKQNVVPWGQSLQPRQVIKGERSVICLFLRGKRMQMKMFSFVNFIPFLVFFIG